MYLPPDNISEVFTIVLAINRIATRPATIAIAPIPVIDIRPKATAATPKGSITAVVPSAHKTGGNLSYLPLFNI